MHSSLIGKIEKARRYAQEPERITIHSLTATFRGSNDTHDLSFAAGRWHCGCEFFAGWNVCCHTMAMERLLAGMTRVDTRESELMGMASARS